MTPVTRKEKYLANIAGGNVSIPTPVTREEMYLNDIANKKEHLLITYTTLAPGDVYGFVNVTFNEVVDAIQSGKHISLTAESLYGMTMTAASGSYDSTSDQCVITGSFVDVEHDMLVQGTLEVYNLFNESHGTVASLVAQYYSLTRT